MSDFHAPVDDILYSLDHIADAARIPDWDIDTAKEILSHFAQLAEGVIAPTNADGDTQGAQLINGRVRLPDRFKDAFAQLADGGWQGASVPEEYGGMALSPLITSGISEIFSGANHSLQMVCNLVPGAAKTLMRYGTDAQKSEWLPKLADGRALSTMCLTEPQAGSDLAAIQCRAEPLGDDWILNGEKIFISGGDQNLTETILHLVLARSEQSSSGVKGLSLFICKPQLSVSVSRLERKLGLHASPTCHMLFENAKAELVGELGQGLAAMFTLMNHARIDVALQGVGHAARAADLAQRYADDRIQGRKADGTKTRLSDHADVMRMLSRQHWLAATARAACHMTLAEMELSQRPALIEFLTPLCKIMGSEAGIEAADLGIQIMGGYGYLTEYGMEQIWRDARITAIYEGANGIHRRALARRGIRPEGGADEFAQFIHSFATEHDELSKRLVDWERQKEALKAAENPDERAFEFSETAIELMTLAARKKIRATLEQCPNPRRFTE